MLKYLYLSIYFDSFYLFYRYVVQRDMVWSDFGTWDMLNLYKCTMSSIPAPVNPVLFTALLLISPICLLHWINVWVWSPSLIPPALHGKQITTITRLSIIVEKKIVKTMYSIGFCLEQICYATILRVKTTRFYMLRRKLVIWLNLDVKIVIWRKNSARHATLIFRKLIDKLKSVSLRMSNHRT